MSVTVVLFSGVNRRRRAQKKAVLNENFERLPFIRIGLSARTIADYFGMHNITENKINARKACTGGEIIGGSLETTDSSCGRGGVQSATEKKSRSQNEQ